MTEKFNWPRMHKDEEHLEREAQTCVEDAILRHYGIEEIGELTEAQWEEIHAGKKNMLVRPRTWDLVTLTIFGKCKMKTFSVVYEPV